MSSKEADRVTQRRRFLRAIGRAPEEGDDATARPHDDGRPGEEAAETRTRGSGSGSSPVSPGLPAQRGVPAAVPPARSGTHGSARVEDRDGRPGDSDADRDRSDGDDD